MDRDMLEELRDLTKENNEILHKLHASHRRSELARIVMIIISLIFVLGSYYYLAPYLKTITAFYKSAQGAWNNPNAEQFKNLFNQFSNPQ